MVTIKWSNKALSDLENIRGFISKDSPRDANLFIKNVIKKVDILENFPYSGRVVPEKNNSELRELLYKKYRVIYQIQNEIATILFIFHQSRILHFD